MLIIAVFISLAVHMVFLASSNFLIMPGMQQMKADTRLLFRIEAVKKDPENVRLFEEPRENVPAIKMSNRVPGTDDEALKKMLLDDMIDKEIYLESKKEVLSEEKIDDEIRSVDEPVADEIFESESEKTREEAAPEKRSILRPFMGKGIITASRGDDSVSPGMEVQPERQGFKWAVPTTGIMKTLKGGLFRPGEGEFSGTRRSAKISDYEDISTFVEVEVFKYVEPESGNKYFKLVIGVKEDSNLRVIPKEVLFLIDSSKSVTEKKLDNVKSAVIESIWGLNSGDRFNVIAFRGDLVRFKDRSVRVGTRNLLEAEMFIRKLEAVGQTDVDNALLGIVDTPLDHVPSYIMLITDGRPTTGVTDSRRIIQQITRHNDMKRPIFSFGGGQRVNRYLLDFISYQNRGWSRFSDRVYSIDGEFQKLYVQIKDPLLLNVRYRLSNLDPEEVYPKYLSDFYKGKKFTVYGRYDRENEFSMQLLGEIDGEVKELIFKKSINEATPGGPEIAREWAFRKIYYLISQDTISNGKRAKVRDEIDRLSRKYGIITPYDIEQTD